MLEPWWDQSLEKWEDFSPAIHQKLQTSDAIVLILDPLYFKSPWCIHELHFALGQHDLRGVPLYWFWCTEEIAKHELSSLWPAAVAKWKKEAIDVAEDSEYYRVHIDDRLERLRLVGVCLSQRVVSLAKDSISRELLAVNSLYMQELIRPVIATEEQIRERRSGDLSR
jgi:hypothetical protein